MTTATERKYALTKVSAGDYLLPSNDGQNIWRIARGDEAEGSENERTVSVWQLWRVRPEDVASGYVDTSDWDRWILCDSWIESRAKAIEAAMRYGITP